MRRVDVDYDRCPPVLDGGDQWLASRLRDAGVGFNDDDGAGFVLSEAPIRIWVTSSTHDERVEAAYRDVTALWVAGATHIYYRPSQAEMTSLYWRAGGVDNSAEFDGRASEISEDIKAAIARLIDAEERSPHAMP